MEVRCTISHRLLLLPAAALLLAYGKPVAEPYVFPEALGRRLVTLIMEQDYNEGLYRLDSLQKASPQDPAGWFFEALVQELRMIDYERNDRTARFDSVCRRAAALLEQRLAWAPDDPWLLYLDGTLSIVRAGHCIRFGNYLDASQDLRQGISRLKQAEERPGAPLDAGLFPAIVVYGREEVARYFAWIKFWEDEREQKSQGITRLEEVARSSRLSREVAKMALIAIYQREKKWDRAYQLIQELLRPYPRNRAVLWLWASTCAAQKEWEQAIEVYDRLEQELAQIPGYSPYNQASLWYLRAVAFYEVKALLGAQEACRVAESWVQRDPQHPQRYREMQTEMHKLLQRINREKKK